MNEQQLAAVKQALEALMVFRYAPPAQRPLVLKAIADLEQVIAQDALYKMAEDAVTIGLSYNDWPKIGCVNHDCDKCRAVQEPVGCEGAIVNGRVYADRLEHDYKFECEAGPLHLCTDWVEFRRCFEWLATHLAPPAAKPAVQREHITDGRQCWCNPDIDYVDPETGAAVIVHKEPQ
jgi:hypothetical protein